jgi:hypothetical protein
MGHHSKSLLAAAGVLALLLAPGRTAGEPFTIEVTRKTVSRTKGAEQEVPIGETRAIEKRIVYELSLRRLSTATPSDATVEWIVAVERAGGRTMPGAAERKTVNLPFGQPVRIETPEILLRSREWQNAWQSGAVEDTIAGYGLRILGPDGAVLAEKYEPISVKERIDWSWLRGPVPPSSSPSVSRPDSQPRQPPPRLPLLRRSAPAQP